MKRSLVSSAISSFLSRAKMSDLAHAEEFEAEWAAGALILAKDTKKILIAQRGIMGDFPMVWGTTGGCPEEGEGPRQAVRREVQEETGYDGPMDLHRLMVCKTGDFTYFNFLGIVPWQFEPQKDEENNAFRWVDFNDWPSPLHPGFQRLLDNHVSMTKVMNHVYDLPDHLNNG